MKVSQSLIKDILPVDFCSHFIHLRYVEGSKTAPSTAMENGLFFESELLGSARGGKFELPRKKNGEPYKRETDLLENVEYAKAIFEELNVKIDEVQPYKEKDGRSGHLDAKGSVKGNKAIIDVKWTGESRVRWWSTFHKMWKEHFNIQSRHYQSLMDDELDFYFFIFGASNWCEVIHIKYDKEAVIHHIENVSDIAKYKFENLQDYEFTATFNKCNECKLNKICQKKIVIPEILEWHDLVN